MIQILILYLAEKAFDIIADPILQPLREKFNDFWNKVQREFSETKKKETLKDKDCEVKEKADEVKERVVVIRETKYINTTRYVDSNEKFIVFLVLIGILYGICTYILLLKYKYIQLFFVFLEVILCNINLGNFISSNKESQELESLKKEYVARLYILVALSIVFYTGICYPEYVADFEMNLINNIHSFDDAFYILEVAMSNIAGFSFLLCKVITIIAVPIILLIESCNRFVTGGKSIILNEKQKGAFYKAMLLLAFITVMPYLINFSQNK